MAIPGCRPSTDARLATRRQTLRTLAGGALAAIASPDLPVACYAAESFRGKTAPRYRIGVCDWMILKRQKLGAVERAQQLGVDGVEVDMGSLGGRETFENKLANEDFRTAYLNAADQAELQICSLAMSGFYAQSFAERPTVSRMVGDCLQTMQQMGVGVAFLPLGVQGDLVKRPELRPAIVERLRRAGRRAADAGLVIGVATALDAAGEAALLDEIDSPAVRSYFNFANPLQAGRDLCAELETLGKDRICQIHCTDEDGVLLADNKRLELERVKKTLDDMGWSGWLVMERSRDASDPHNIQRNYGANAAYLKSVFQNG